MSSEIENIASRKDVAKAAGVSVTTVTHALNDTPGTRVKPRTVEKIKRIAKEMNYRPNFVGRALVTGKNYAVGLLQPSHGSLFSFFYQEIVYGLVKAMEEDDYNLVVLFRSDDYRYLRPLEQNRLDGMFVLQSDFDREHIRKVSDYEKPTLVINNIIPSADNPLLGSVYSDHYRLMREVMEEFVEKGAKSILSFHDYRMCEPNHHMFEAFLKLTESYSDQGVVGTSMIPSEGNISAQIRNAFASGQRWDGIFVDGPSYAEIVLREAEACGLKPGKDFLLISTSTTDGETSSSRGEMSAYTQQAQNLGFEAWGLMKTLLEGESETREIAVPYKRYSVNDNQILSTNR